MPETKKVNLKEKRESKGLTQLELSILADVSVSYIQALERGYSRRPSVDVAQKLAEILDFDWTLYFPPKVG